MEQPDRVFRGCLLHFVSRNALQLGNFLDDCREDQRFYDNSFPEMCQLWVLYPMPLQAPSSGSLPLPS